MAEGLRIPGAQPTSSNPLFALTEALGKLQGTIEGIERNTRPDATAVLPHRYALSIYNDPGHGRVWGAFCMACTDSAGQYVYPCQLDPEEQVKPPNFFTIGDVFIPDETGRLLKHEGPAASSN